MLLTDCPQCGRSHFEDTEGPIVTLCWACQPTAAHFTTGFYQPSPAFRQILEHTAVMDANNQTLIALTGPAHDPESEAHARLFAAAPQLLGAATFALRVMRDNRPIETSGQFFHLLAIAKLEEAIIAAQKGGSTHAARTD